MKRRKTTEQILKENQELRIRLAEAEETLQAIREGAVDAVVIQGPKGEQVFTLTGEEQVYRRLVETMSEAGLTTTPEGRILFCNERFSKMLRRPMEEIVGRTIEEFIQKSHHKDIASLLKGAQVNLSRKRLTFLAGDGTIVPSRVSANLLTQGESVSICMVAMDLTELEASEEIIRQIQEQKEALEESSAALRDSRRAALNIMEDALSAQQRTEELNNELLREINERKQAEEALLASETRYRRLFEAARDGILILDAESGQIIDVNPFIKDLLGYSHEELLGKKLWEIGILKNIAASKESFVELQKKGFVRYENMPLETKDGSHISVEFVSNVYSVDHKKVIQCNIRDITERKKAEDALRQSQEDLSRAQEVGNTGSWRLDIHKNILTWSDENYRIFGIPKGTAMAYETFLSTIHPDDHEYVDRKWKSALAGEPYDIEHRIIVGDKIKWVREKAYLEFDKDGVLLGGFGITQDITNLKQSEQAIIRSKERLEILSETAGKLLESKNPQEIINDLCTKVMIHLDCQIFINYFVDEQKNRLHLNTCGGLPEETAKKIEWLDFGQAICGRVAKEGKRIVAENIQESCDSRADLVRSMGISAYACHPLKSAEKVIGTLSFGTSSRISFSEEDLAMMKTVADQAATAMERIMHEETLRKINEQLEQRVKDRTIQLSNTINTLESEVIERIRAEKESREKSDILDALFASTTTPLVLLDRNFNFIRVSDTYAKACQKDITEFKGHNHFEFYPHAENQAIFEDVVRTKKAYTTIAKPFEFPDHPEWGVTYWDWTLFPLLNEKGEVEFLVFSLEDVTKRTQMEKALREREERYRGLTVATSQIIWTTNADGEVTEDIPSWRAFTGQTMEQIRGWGWSEALHPEDLEKTKAIWSQSVRNRAIYDTEYRIRGKDRQYRYFSARGVPILEDGGRVREWVGTCTDITERKNAEILTKVTNKLLEQFAKQSSRKEYLDSVVETIGEWSGCRCVGIRLLDEDGLISYASHKGFPNEFLERENNISINNDICVCIRVVTEQIEAPDRRFMTPRGSFDCNDTAGFMKGLAKKEKKLFRGNCIRFGYASVSVVPIRYREKVLGAIHLADKTPGRVPAEKVEFLENMAMLVGEAVHRFDMEEELRESEERYRELVELSPDGIGVEINEKIAFINSAGAKLLGAKSDKELIGRPIAKFIHPDFRRRSLKLLSYMRKKGVTLPPREAKFVRLDGKDFDVEVAATALVYKDKSAAQIVFRDISDRKATEKEIMATQEKLRSLTAELVLAEERERRAAAMALHDSLGPILAFSKRELGILQKTMSKKDADALKHISNNISDAVQQTRNLTFDLSPPALYTFGLETAVAELAEKFALEQDIQISFEKGEELKPLPDHLKVLLYRSVRELLINITKHSDAKNVRLMMSQADDNIKIVVEDDGKGFESSTYGTKTFWTKGFGLFSIRERLTHVGGTIDIKSSRGKGTVVTLLAPLEKENNKKEVS